MKRSNLTIYSLISNPDLVSTLKLRLTEMKAHTFQLENFRSIKGLQAGLALKTPAVVFLEITNDRDLSILKTIHQEHAQHDFSILGIIPTYSLETINEAVKNGTQDAIVLDQIPSQALERVISTSLERIRLFRIVEAQRDRLEKSSKLAQVGLLTSQLVHDVANSLSIISAMTEMLSSDLDEGKINPEGIKKTAKKIMLSSQRAILIFKNMQIFLRNGANDKKEEISFNSLIKECVELCKQRFLENDTEVKLDLPVNDILLHCQKSEMYQLIINLLQNAIDATQVLSNRWVEISLKEKKDILELRIRDSGLGIPPEIAKKMFEPLFSTKAPGKGTGIGLSSANDAIRRHGGSIGIDHSDKNTCFIIKIPKLQEKKEAA